MRKASSRRDDAAPPAPAPPPTARAPGADAARTDRAGSLRSLDSVAREEKSRRESATTRDGRVPRGGRGEELAGGGSADLVRAKILETMKKGIADSRSRNDLADGERRLLEHMKLYVMETKVAESHLSEEEALIWEDMKAEYLEQRGISED